MLVRTAPSLRPLGRGRRTMLACAIGLLGLALAGCGGSDSLTGTSTSMGTDDQVFTDTIATDTTFTDTTGTMDTTSTDETWTDTVSTDASTSPPTTYAEAMDRIGSARSVTLDSDHFAGNDTDVYCLIVDAPGITACETFEDRHPAPPGQCTYPDAPKDVGRIVMEGSEVTPVCNSDTIRDGGVAQRIPSGATVASPDGSRRCLALPEGIACIDTSTRQGFFMGNSGYTVFP